MTRPIRLCQRCRSVEAHFAEIDALLDRTDKVLAGETPLRKSRSHLVYDPEVDEAENEDCGSMWSSGQVALAGSRRGGRRLGCLARSNLYTRQPWLGFTMAASILRARGLTSHLLPLAAGFKQSKFRPQGREGQEKLQGFCSVLEEALRSPTRISSD